MDEYKTEEMLDVHERGMKVLKDENVYCKRWVDYLAKYGCAKNSTQVAREYKDESNVPKYKDELKKLIPNVIIKTSNGYEFSTKEPLTNILRTKSSMEFFRKQDALMKRLKTGKFSPMPLEQLKGILKEAQIDNAPIGQLLKEQLDKLMKDVQPELRRKYKRFLKSKIKKDFYSDIENY